MTCKRKSEESIIQWWYLPLRIGGYVKKCIRWYISISTPMPWATVRRSDASYFWKTSWSTTSAGSLPLNVSWMTTSTRKNSTYKSITVSRNTSIWPNGSLKPLRKESAPTTSRTNSPLSILSMISPHPMLISLQNPKTTKFYTVLNNFIPCSGSSTLFTKEL